MVSTKSDPLSPPWFQLPRKERIVCGQEIGILVQTEVCTLVQTVVCILGQVAVCTPGHGGGMYTGPGGGLYTGPGGGLYTGPGGVLYTGPCDEPYQSNWPPQKYLIEYLIQHGMNSTALCLVDILCLSADGLCGVLVDWRTAVAECVLLGRVWYNIQPGHERRNAHVEME